MLCLWACTWGLGCDI